MPRPIPLVLLLLALRPVAAYAQYLEVEPNDSKLAATVVTALAPAGTIDGLTTGADASGGPTSADYYRIRVTAPPGIWRHTLTLTATPTPVPDSPGHTLTLRGLGQAAGVILGTDEAAQTAPALPLFFFGYRRQLFFYSVGDPAEVYCAVTGTAATTAPYRLTLLTEPARILDFGTFAPGTLTIESTTLTNVSSNDTDLWVHDGNLQAIPGYGNDDRLTPTPNKAPRLVRSFTPGTYWVSAAPANLANNQTSPFDDGQQNGRVLDFPNVAATGRNGIVGVFTLAISDGSRTASQPLPSLTVNNEVFWCRFTVASTCAPPAFTQQPVSTVACLGHPVTLVASASGTAPLVYQWRYETTPIPGATSPTLVIPAAAFVHAGSYDVVVTNACGQIMSAPAVLTVLPAGPILTKDPQSLTLCPGKVAAFEVAATPRHQGAISYQWRHDGDPIAGATAATHSFTVVGVGDGGQYDCVVTEADCGSVTSAPAILTVRNAAPAVTLVGPATVVLECHRDAYIEPGATALDDCDGSVAVTIGGDTVDTHAVGTYVLTYDARDSQGNWATTVKRWVIVQDTAPPAVGLASTTQVLWSPDHKLANVGLAAAVTDACDAQAAATLEVRVFADEHELPGTGDATGQHAPDAANLAPPSLRLRSERQATGDGRVYLIVGRARDASGNAGFGLCTVVVPANQSPAALVAVQQQAAAAVLAAGGLVASTATIDAVVATLLTQGWSEVGLSEARGPWQ